ncbi:MAG TPA: ribosomal protein S18-alanine N-acetyltransferase [Methylovirgula sp.]|nr:ribosomal protein S18-alanine N-acetyltransferase [Methylovirgula sp.]
MFGWFEKSSSIRRIGPEFGRACAKIHAQSFAHPWSAAEFESLLAGRDIVGQAAISARLWNARGVTGFVLSRRALDTAEMLTIAVAPATRGKGIGSALLASHLAALAAEGAKSLFLEVEADNRAALALYQRFDFRQVGERKAYYRKADGNRAAALILRRDFD